MKKWITSVVVCFLFMFASPFYNEALAKVLWDGMELKKGQIGKATIIKPTELYKLNGTTKKVVRKLNPGEVYRIYTFLPGKLGLGGGYFIDRDNRVKYQTPSKEKLQALGVKIIKRTYKDTFDYPQVTGLISKSAQDKINETLAKHVRASYNAYMELERTEQEHSEQYSGDFPESMLDYEYKMSYEVKYNENNLLSILIYDYMYTGGAHGMSTVTAYNFNVLTGQRLYLSDVAKSQSALNKIKKYAITDLTNRANRGEAIFTEELSGIEINSQRPFYFTANGIVIKFYEYEVAPYAAGMPEVKVPYSVFK